MKGRPHPASVTDSTDLTLRQLCALMVVVLLCTVDARAQDRNAEAKAAEAEKKAAAQNAAEQKKKEAAADEAGEAQSEDGAPANPLTDLIKRVFGGGDNAEEMSGEEETAESEAADDASFPGRDNVDAHAASSPKLNKNLTLARRAVEQEEWLDAVRLLQALLDEPQDFLYPRPDGEWVSLQREAELRIATLPEAGRRTYQTEYTGVAQQMLTAGGGLGNLEACIEVARRYGHTQPGQRAADAIATMYFDRGAYDLAARWYLDLWETRGPVTESVEWRARAIYALILAGRDDEVSSLLNALGDEAVVPWLARSDEGGRMADWLQQQEPAPSGPIPEYENWVTLYGSPSRIGSATGGDPLLLRRWQQPLTYRYAIKRQIDDLLLDLEDNQRAPIPAMMPVVVNGRVAFRTLRGLAVADIATGRLLWESSEGVSPERLLTGDAQSNSPSRTVRMRIVGRVVADYGANQFDQHQLTGLLFRDGGYGLLSSDGRRLFAIEQSALMAQSNYGYWWGGMDPSSQDAFGRDWASNQIVAFDLESGAQLWEVGGRRMHEPFDPPLAGTFFLGPPVADGEQLYVIGERDKEVILFVLSSQNGELLWSQVLAAVTTSIEFDSVRRLWACQPSVDAGTIVCPTGAGWLIALDRHTRRIQWAHRYAARRDDGRNNGGAQMHSLQPLNERWCQAAPILADGRVVFTPDEQPDETGQDQPRLLCLDALSGQKLWEQEKGNSLYLGGVFNGTVVVVGRHDVRGLSLQDGSAIWTTPVPAESGPPAGRGAAVGDRFLLPLVSGELWALDVNSGQIDSRSRLPEDAPTLGNLVMHDGTLLSLGAYELTGFEQRDTFEQQIAVRKAADPSDLWASVREAEMLSVTRDYAAALAALDRAERESAGADPELVERHRRLTFETLLALTRADLTGRDDEFGRAGGLTESAAENLELTRVDAARRVARGDWEGAFDIYWQLPRQYPADLMIDDGDVTIRLDLWAGGRLASLWEQVPADRRASLDVLVRDAVTAALIGSRDEQVQIERLCRFHTAAADVTWALIERASQDGDFAAAEVRLRRLIAGGDPVSAARAWHRLGQLLVQFGQSIDAAACFAALERQYADVALPDGQTGAVAADAWFDAEQLDRDILGSPEVAVWSNDEFELSRSRRTGGNFYYGQPPVILDSGEAFYDRHEFVFQPQSQSPSLRIEGIASDEAYWTVPLRTSQPQNYNQGAAVMTSGLQAVVLHQGVLHALSLPDRRVLWSQALSERGHNVYTRNVYDNDSHSLQPANGFTSRAGLTRGQSPAGMLAMATPTGVAYYGRGEFVVVDPVTGEVLWRRRGIPPQTSLYGNADTIYVVTPNRANTHAVRAADGQRIDVENLPELVEDAVAVRQAGLVLVERGSSRRTLGASRGKLLVRLYDPITDAEAWRHEFDARSRLAWLDPQTLLVLDESSSDCLSINAETGESVQLGTVPVNLVKDSSEVLAVADAEHVYIVLNHLRNSFVSYVNPPAVRVNGTVVALRRNGQGEAWQRVVENQNLLLTQFAHSPLMVFLTYQHVHLEKLQTVYAKSQLVVLDKGTGAVAVEDDRASPGGGYYQLELSRSDRSLEIRSHNERILIQAREPAPAAAASR